jgi:ketosteroid isomerase-like protein
MSDVAARAVVEKFYQAYDTRDPQRISAFLDNDVEWNVYGPIEAMQVCGQWRGKAAVIDRFTREIPDVLDKSVFERDCLLVDGGQSAAFGHVTSRQRKTGRIISHRCAHFIAWRDDKILSFRCINDGLDAVEQFLGHRIDLSADASESDIVAI